MCGLPQKPVLPPRPQQWYRNMRTHYSQIREATTTDSHHNKTQANLRRVLSLDPAASPLGCTEQSPGNAPLLLPARARLVAGQGGSACRRSMSLLRAETAQSSLAADPSTSVEQMLPGG